MVVFMLIMTLAVMIIMVVEVCIEECGYWGRFWWGGNG